MTEQQRIEAVNTALHTGQAIGLLKKKPAIAELRKRNVSSTEWAVQEKEYVLKKSPERRGKYMWLPEVGV